MKIKQVRLSLFGHTFTLFGFSGSSIIMLPNTPWTRDHITFMRYADPNHENYGKFDFHVTRGREHETIAGPWTTTDLEKKIKPILDYATHSQVPLDKIDSLGKFYTINPEYVNRFIQLEQVKRSLNISLNLNAHELQHCLSTVSGGALLRYNSTPSLTFAVQESEPDNLLVGGNGKYFLFNKNEFFGTMSNSLGFNLDTLDLLKP